MIGGRPQLLISFPWIMVGKPFWAVVAGEEEKVGGLVHSLDRSCFSAGEVSRTPGLHLAPVKGAPDTQWAPLRTFDQGARSEDAVGKSAARSDIRSGPAKNKQPGPALLLFPWVRAELPDTATREDRNPCCSPCETMPRLCVVLLGCTFLLALFCLTGAEDAGKGTSEEGQAETRDKRSMPNWSLTSSDFFAWVEHLRAHAGYDRIEDLARTFWAHFPSASQLGYDTPDPDE